MSYHSGLNLVECFEKLDVTLILCVSCKENFFTLKNGLQQFKYFESTSIIDEVKNL